MAIDWDGERGLRVARVIRAPLPLVWRSLTEADLWRRWWAPAPFVVAEMVLEQAPGGRFFTDMILPDGGAHRVEMMILCVDAGQRLVFTDLMTAGFRPVAEPMFGFAAEIALAEAAGGTSYSATATARHARAPVASGHRETGFHEGWGRAAEQLAALAPTL